MKIKVWKCRGCGERVFTAYGRHGKRMVINRDPSDEGNLVLKREPARFGEPPFIFATVVPPKAQSISLFEEEEGDAGRETRYIDHHATCPKAKDFR